jgi:hypothetical protein
MAQTTLTPQQAARFQQSNAAGIPSAATSSHRNPKSMRSIRWTMGREAGTNFMQWWVNPSECQWKVATRTTFEKISGGIVHHEWPQTGMYGSNASFVGSRFDQPMLSLSFQSGIITPGGYNDILSGVDNTGDPPPGLGNFFDFLDLLDRPDAMATGAPNYINILYTSPIFGQRGMRLQGFFTEEGVAWTDSADNPNLISSWGATFMVYNSQPKLDSLLQNFELLNIPT